MPPSHKKHDWNRLQNYIGVHHSVLKKYETCFVNHPQYTIRRKTDQWVDLFVTLHFVHMNIKLEVEKTAEVKVHGGSLEVARTYEYTYAASDKLGNFFRYCSPHRTHHKFHHKHVFDLITRQEIGRPLELHPDEYPHVDEVIEEVLRL